MEYYKMREIDEIIGRAESLLCISDRAALEKKILQGQYHPWKDREEQRLFIYSWLEDNGFKKYMTNTEKTLFEKKIGNPFLKRVFQEKEFEYEAIEPLLWSMGLVKRLSSYDWYVIKDLHPKLETNVPDTYKRLKEKVVLKSEDEIILQDQVAMLWHWRAIEGKNQLFKKEPIRDVLLGIFGEAYKEAIDKILKKQKKKQDFMIGDKYVYELNSKELSHLYKRTTWRYHAFEWLLTEEDWDDVQLNT